MLCFIQAFMIINALVGYRAYLYHILIALLLCALIATEAGLIESAASASIVIRFFQKLNKIPMAKNASLS